MTADGWLEVWGCEETLMAEHAAGDVVCELFHLLSYVVEEGITGPASYHHDGEGGNSCKVHGHGGSGSDGVGADVCRFKA